MDLIHIFVNRKKKMDMKKPKLTISDNIKNIREKKGYSQEYMSDMLQVSQQTYSLTEKNPEKANLSRIQQIAKILNVKLSFLLNEEDAFVLNSLHQKGGNAISYMHTGVNEEFYQKMIQQMQEEITFLRNILNKKMNSSQEKFIS